MTQQHPVISVIMANYNTGHYLKLAIESILNQTFRDFEFIIIDDCSTNSEDIAYLESITDSRLQLIRNATNLGQTASLNKGIAHAKGQYIARMDSDDISTLNRFERQVAILNERPTISIVGSQAYLIDSAGKNLGTTSLPTTADSIWAYSILQCSLIHPVVMLRASIFKDLGYTFNTNYINQDFELWSRLLPSFLSVNIKEPLIYYRIRPDSMTSRYLEENIRNSVQIVSRRLVAENMENILSVRDIDMLLRYFFSSRSCADTSGVNRLELGHIMWRIYLVVNKRRNHLGEYRYLIIYRLFQLALWPDRMNNMVSRIVLFYKIFFKSPVSLAVVLFLTMPLAMVRRFQSRSYE